MHIERPHRGDDNGHIRLQPCVAVDDVEELLRTQVRGEAALSDHVIGQLQSRSGGDDGIVAMGDVGKGSAVDKARLAFQGLHQVGLDCILQKDGHRPMDVQIPGEHRAAVVVVGHEHPAQPLLQVVDVLGQAQDSHDLRGDGDVKAALHREAVAFAAKAHHDVAQLPIVHVHDPAPEDLLRVNSQFVSFKDVVLQDRGEQVVGRSDGMDVPGEVEVDVLHGDDLGVASSGRASLDAKGRSQRRLPQTKHHVFPQFAEGLGDPHRGAGLPFPAGVAVMAVV